jgi:hypothetical protein
MKPEPQPTWYGSLKDTATYFLLLGLAFAFFFYSADFTKGQSGLLGWVVGSFMFALYRWKREDRKRLGFTPFRVTITPNWYRLFLDFRVLDEQGFEALRGQRESAADEIRARRYDVLRDGVTFTVLRPNLIFRDDNGSFRSSVDLEVEIQEIAGRVDAGLVGFPDYAARLCVKRCPAGYQLGLKTAESYQRARSSEHMRGLFEDFGPELIRVAVLPYQQFWPFYGLEPTLKTERQLVQVLKEQGWENTTDRELRGLPLELRHEYFTLHYREI